MRHQSFSQAADLLRLRRRNNLWRTLRRLNVELPQMIGSGTNGCKPRGEQAPAPTGLVVMLSLFRRLL